MGRATQQLGDVALRDAPRGEDAMVFEESHARRVWTRRASAQRPRSSASSL